LSDLTDCFAVKLEQAISGLLMVSEEAINEDGKSLEDLRKGLVEL